ncbi:transporter [Salinibacterium sp. SWN1162]|uniref:transporter n=1 Tax=Salinibacterium sp. SWN1162 TaxID=2792053 RepID=UPI0018CF52C5|nr:transporter [Salinibacterium sp. SWN1162]MBH0009387.1 transporter [Salinibacterium sp. SWN1162]
MVAHLVRLRFRLLANALTRSPWQAVAVILGTLYGLFTLLLAVVGLVFLSSAPSDFGRTVTVIGGAILILGWTFLPLLSSGIDETVEPAKLATFPIPVTTLLIALAASGLLGVPGIITTLAAFATSLVWWQTPMIAVVAVFCGAIGALTCVVGSRMLAALTVRISSGRRAREAKTVLVLIPLLLLGPAVFALSRLFRDLREILPVISDVIAWTPFGAIWAVPGDLATGHPGAAALHALIGLATLVAATGVWRWALDRSLERPAGATTTASSSRGLGLFAVFSGTPTGAVAARSLTYWLRDPRYAQSLISIPLVPAIVFFYSGTSGDLTGLLFVGPIVAVLLGMSIYTDVSYDNTAFSLHLQTAVSGRADRWGRVIAVSVFAVPTTIILTVASVWISDSGDRLVGMLGISLGLLITGLALSSLVSGRFAFSVPAPGDNPFKSRPGGGFTLMLSMFASWTALAVLALPEMVIAIIGFATFNETLGWVALAVGLALSTALLVVGVRVGGRILDERGPELLVQLQRQK